MMFTNLQFFVVLLAIILVSSASTSKVTSDKGYDINLLNYFKTLSLTRKNDRNLFFYEDQIREIVPGNFTNLDVDRIMICFTNITILKKGSFTNLTIQHLSLNYNQISVIEVGAFENVKKLENLELDHNRIEELDKEVFDNLPLRRLDLSHNSISSIPRGFFTNRPQLKVVYLSFNKLTNISEGIFDNLPLELVDLSQNDISYIAPTAFDNMSELANIYLSSNKLTRYDTNWFHNTKDIYRLYLHDNLIEEIPEEAFRNIYNHKKQWIRLNSNKMKKISPEAFRGFKKFDTLDLANNEIKTWNDDLLRDTEVIYYLNLGYNQIKCVEGDFDNIFIANNTYLGGNPLSQQCIENIELWKRQQGDKLKKVFY